MHPFTYVSCSVSTAESIYASTSLEKLVVVWKASHFKYYHYGHNVTIITDHAAVKAISGTPNLSGHMQGGGQKSMGVV